MAGPLQGVGAVDRGGNDRLGLADGDLCLLVAGPDRVSSPALDRVRQDVARRLDLIPADASSFLWVMDFPLFDKDAETGKLAAVHHPFTAPHPDDMALLGSDPRAEGVLAGMLRAPRRTASR